MDTNTVKITNDKFDFLGEIEDYSSFYFIRSFTKAKEFQLVAPIKYMNILKTDNIIFITHKKAGIIEEVEVDEDKKIITAKGRDLKSIINRRITVPPVGKAYDEIKATAEEVIKHYVFNNCISPSDPRRKIEQLELAIDRKKGPIIAWQSRFKYLDFELEQLCNATGLGYEIYLDIDNKKFIFDVIEGIDRTVEQDINSRVIFSYEFNNIRNSTHTNNSQSYRTMGYIAGQGEGDNRTIEEVYKNNSTGLERRELFIDARDISEAENLGDRARAKLNEYDFITSNESTVLNNNFIYECDWDLGDMVTLKNSTGTTPQRVIEVTEIYEGNRRIEVVLGSVIPNPLEKIQSQLNSIPSSGGGTSGGGDKAYTHSQISPSSIWNINHGLNKRPSVSVVDSGGSLVMGEVKYVDDNNIQITFSAAFAGNAYLN